MRRGFSKKLLSIILAVVMMMSIVGIVPMTAKAADEEGIEIGFLSENKLSGPAEIYANIWDHDNGIYEVPITLPQTCDEMSELIEAGIAYVSISFTGAKCQPDTTHSVHGVQAFIGGVKADGKTSLWDPIDWINIPGPASDGVSGTLNINLNKYKDCELHSIGIQFANLEVGAELNYKVTSVKLYTADWKTPDFNIHTLIPTETVKATCTEGGNITYYTCEQCGKIFSDEDGKIEITKDDTAIEATGHDYKMSLYSWVSNDSVKGIVLCNKCGDPIEETVKPECEVIKPATCTEAGEGKYTAKFESEFLETQTKSDVIPALGHKLTKTEEVPATCTEDGNIEYWTCDVCNIKFKDEDATIRIISYETIIGKTDHDFGEWEVTKEPTVSEEGEETRVCKNDSSHIETRPIDKLDPEPEKPGDEPGKNPGGDDKPAENPTETPTEKPTEDSTHKEENVMSPDGTALGAGASEAVAEQTILSAKSDEGPAGSVFGTLQFKSAKTTKKSISLSWKKIKGCKYIVYGNACGKKYEKLVTVKTNKYTAKKLKKGKYYKFLVVAIKDGKVVSASKTIHVTTSGGKYGNYKSIKVNKKKVTLKKGKTFKIKTKQVAASKLKVKKHRAVAYESSNTKVATVKKGIIKAVGKGTAYIYVYGQNGVSSKIKVTVK